MDVQTYSESKIPVQSEGRPSLSLWRRREFLTLVTRGRLIVGGQRSPARGPQADSIARPANQLAHHPARPTIVLRVL